jgi:prephenate dehydrogenase
MRVAIIGTGLIGGSVGLALKARSEGVVVAYDRAESISQRAVERGAADQAARSIQEAVSGADVVFVATPVGAIAASVAEAAKAAVSGAIITDVGSTKERVVLEVEGSLPRGLTFVGGHPMAGTEQDGIDAASPDLFDGAWWILTPTDKVDPDTYGRLHGLLTTLGARIMALKPAEHDELMAVVSHLPQLTATALMNMAAERGEDHAGLLALAAGGFRDVTRVAASNPEIWLDICRENRDAIVSTLGLFADRLLTLRDLVKQDDQGRLREALLQAREARRTLPGKPLEAAAFEVSMPVPDHPGVLSAVTTSIGNLGINIEDLQITHSAEGGRGVLRLMIAGEAEARRVAETLRAQGFDAQMVEL